MADDSSGDRVEGYGLFPSEKLMQTQILVSHFAQGAHLLAQRLILLSEFLVLSGKESTRLDEGKIVSQLHKRRAKLYKNHTQLTRESGGLAQKCDPANHQQPDNDQISPIQSNFRACR